MVPSGEIGVRVSIAAAETYVCPDCGRQFDQIPEFCPECGAQFNGIDDSEAPANIPSANENAPNDGFADVSGPSLDNPPGRVALTVRTVPSERIPLSERFGDFVRGDPIAIAAIGAVFLLALIGVPYLVASWTATPPSSKPVEMYVAHDGATVHTDASASGETVVILARGQSLEGEMQTGDDGSSWFKIEGGQLDGDFIAATDLTANLPAPVQENAPAASTPQAQPSTPSAPPYALPQAQPSTSAPPAASPQPPPALPQATAPQEPATSATTPATAPAPPRTRSSAHAHRPAPPVKHSSARPHRSAHSAPAAAPAPPAEPTVSCVLPGGQMEPMTRGTCRDNAGVVFQN
jgi:hypothetical protein